MKQLAQMQIIASSTILATLPTLSNRRGQDDRDC